MSDTRQLGRFTFEVQIPDQALKEELSSCFLPCNSVNTATPYTVSLSDVRSIVNTALRHHDGCLWLDAAALISPSGKKTMIVGASHSGKSTCTVALALKKNWKVLSEDITLFDLTSDKLVSFASPFSLKPGTAERLSAHDCHPPRIVFNEWIPLNGMAAGQDVGANLDFAFHFACIEDPTAPGPLEVSESDQNAFVRRLLSISNLVHANRAMEKLHHYLSKSRCLKLSGGTISERLEKITEIVESA